MQLSLEADDRPQDEPHREPQGEVELRGEAQVRIHRSMEVSCGRPGAAAMRCGWSSADQVADPHAWSAPPASTRQSQIATKPTSSRTPVASNAPPATSP